MFTTMIRRTERLMRSGSRTTPRVTSLLSAAVAAVVLAALAGCDDAVLQPLDGSAIGEPPSASASNSLSSANAQLAAIQALQSAFHGAIRNSDYDAMLALWTEDAVLMSGGVTSVGPQEIADFIAEAPPFVNGWASLAPTYKTTIEVHGNTAEFAFECVFVAETGNLAGETVLAHLNGTGTMRKVGDRWLFAEFQGGAGPL